MTGSSLYRQWRPDRFEEVVGQEHVVTTLKNAISRDQVAHAYIFAGPRGTGKTTIARLLAKSVNCRQTSADNVEPCNNCDPCKDVIASNSMNVVEMDAASHRGIDDIRELQERVPYANPNGRFRVYILDEAHMLTAEAFNALLKTLEEPPAHVIFILCTTEPHKIPVTIHSRCQRFDFRFLTVLEIADRIEMVVAADPSLEVEEAAVWSIAVSAEGAVRDALGLLEQVRDYAGGRISEEDVRMVTGVVSRRKIFEYVELMAKGDIAALLDLTEGVLLGGADMGQFIRELLATFRDMLLFRASDGARKPIIPDDELDRMNSLTSAFDLPRLLEMVDTLSEAESRARYVSRPAFLLEMATIKLARPASVGVDPSEVPVNGGHEQVQVGSTTGETATASSQGDAGAEVSGIEVDSVVGESPAETTSKSDTTPPGDGGELGESEWERIKEAVRRVNMPAYALLQPARPGSKGDGRIVLVFQDGFSYHKERTEKENCELVEKAAAKILGEPVRIKCVFESEVDSPTARAVSANPPDDDEGEFESASRDERGEPDGDLEQMDAETTGDSAGEDLEDVLRAFDGRIVERGVDLETPGSEEGQSIG